MTKRMKRNLIRAFAQALDCKERGRDWEAEARFALIGINHFPDVMDRSCCEAVEDGFLDGLDDQPIPDAVRRYFAHW